MRKIDREHIVLTLGIEMPLSESHRELSEGLKNRILAEQVLFESFIDSLAKYAGEKWNKAVATVRDWKDAAAMLGKIISNPQTLSNFSIGLWKSFLANELKRFKGMLAKMGLQNFIPQVDSMINSVTALQGWKKFMAVTAIASITRYITTKLAALKPDAMAKWVASYFSEDSLGKIVGKLTDFTSYVGWLQPIIKGTEILFDVLKPFISKFSLSPLKPSPQQAPATAPVTERDEMAVLRERIRVLIGEMSEGLDERMLSFPDKTMMPLHGKEQLPYHAPVTTNKKYKHGKRKGSKRKSLREAIMDIIREMDASPNVSTENGLENLKRFVEDKIDFEGYDKYEGTPKSRRLETAVEVFKDEMGWAVRQSGFKRAFTDWIQGLPSVLDIPFYYNEIRNLLYALGYDEVKDMEDQDVAKLYYDELYSVFFKKGVLSEGGFPDAGKTLTAKELDYDMMDYLNRTNRKLLLTLKDGREVKTSCARFHGDLVFFDKGGDTIDRELITSVKILS
jgi:hypothetical protein